MSLRLCGKLPFRSVYIHGLIRDAQGNKMSKSRGNVLDPMDLVDGISTEALVTKRTQGLMQPQLATEIAKTTRREFPQGIEAYGVDALRFTFCSLASTGRDIHFEVGRLVGYRNFCNKLWNAARFVLGNTSEDETTPPAQSTGIPNNGVAEIWIRQQLTQAIDHCHRHLANYRFDLLAATLYHFIWHQYCDWYLELAKVTLNRPGIDPDLAWGTRLTLLEVLEQTLRLLHPITPFITEELWQSCAPRLGRQGRTVMLQPYPGATPSTLHDSEVQAACQAVQWVQEWVTTLRNLRGEMNLSPSLRLSVLCNGGEASDHQYLLEHRQLLCHLAGLAELRLLAAGESPPPSMTGISGTLQLHVPMQGLVDPDQEIKRLEHRISKMEQEIKRLESKLNNERFVDQAPGEVVARQRTRLSERRQEWIKASISRALCWSLKGEHDRALQAYSLILKAAPDNQQAQRLREQAAAMANEQTAGHE